MHTETAGSRKTLGDVDVLYHDGLYHLFHLVLPNHDFNRETHDEYYLSLDLFKGVAQVRAWGSGPDGSGEDMMQFQSLQANYWETLERGEAEIQLLAYGSYLELSVGGRVMLSLADQTFTSGTTGFCVESATIQVEDLTVEHFTPPTQSDEHLANG